MSSTTFHVNGHYVRSPLVVLKCFVFASKQEAPIQLHKTPVVANNDLMHYKKTFESTLQIIITEFDYEFNVSILDERRLKMGADLSYMRLHMHSAFSKRNNNIR